MRDILFVTVDSLRADHLGCYGYHRDTSPHVDQIADSNHVFTNTFSHAGATRASFPAILTSSSPLMYGGFERISERRTLVSEVLDDAGYRTAGFHSNPFLSADFGYDRGFDTFFDAKTTPSMTSRVRQLVTNRLDVDGIAYRTLKKAFDTTEKHVGFEFGSAYVKADDLTDRAIEWLETTETSNPSFLWIHYMDVHHPYVPPKEYQLDFRDTPISERKAVQLRRKMLEFPNEVTKRERSDLIDLYDAEIRFTDSEIGRLVKRATARWDDPVVIVTADHGEEFDDHGQFSHNTPHDEGIHVPLVMNDGTEGAIHDELVGLLDISPTIVDYAGSEIPDNFYGHNIRSIIENRGWERKSVIGDWGQIDGPRHFFYRDLEWKYIRLRGSEALYDLISDPDEQNDVIHTYPDVTDRIRNAIQDHERLVEGTYQDLGGVDITEDVRERLNMLGYTDK